MIHVARTISGDTPLGFLAALGLLRVVGHRDGSARLSWPPQSGWAAVLHTALDERGTSAVVKDDAVSWGQHPLSLSHYLKREKKGLKDVRHTEPPAAVWRAILENALSAEDVEALADLSAFGCEACTCELSDEKVVTAELMDSAGIEWSPAAPQGRTLVRPHLDFTSRNVQFFDQIDRIRKAVLDQRLELALFSAERKPVDGRQMNWTGAADAPGALFGSRCRSADPLLEWLAFRGIGFLQVAPTRGELVTTCCVGPRKRAMFTWPLWDAALSSACVATAVALRGTRLLTARERTARGIREVFSAGLATDATGYDGIFLPAGVVSPAPDRR